ncbi:MAG: 50S ribosomal protein L25/general stress protein Ctc [Pseudobdellovibrionaceae bacterium]
MSNNNYALTANERDRAGKGVARALRRENKVPAVLYGEGQSPALISLAEKEVTIQFQKGGMKTRLCELTIDGKKSLALARDVQLHPVTDRVEHIDFMRVGAKTKINVKVPVHFANQDVSPGMKLKGILNTVYHHLELRCLATDIPAHLELDMAAAEIGDALKLSAIKLPKGAEVVGLGKEDVTIATIAAPIVEVVVAPVAAAPAAAAAKPAAKAKK